MKIFLDTENHEILEKMAVLVQKITYHNDLKGKQNND